MRLYWESWRYPAHVEPPPESGLKTSDRLGVEHAILFLTDLFFVLPAYLPVLQADGSYELVPVDYELDGMSQQSPLEIILVILGTDGMALRAFFEMLRDWTTNYRSRLVADGSKEASLSLFKDLSDYYVNEAYAGRVPIESVERMLLHSPAMSPPVSSDQQQARLISALRRFPIPDTVGKVEEL
jgi:hypothetical protein